MSYEAYRRNKIESGLLYQDFVVDLLLQTIGLAVVQYTSQAYQRTVGESRTGVEIKHDEKYAKTGNLWIECGEKARPRQGDYFPSGINRDDNTWLYVIGDYDTVFGFSKKWLRVCRDSGKYELRENNTRTSSGYLLPAKHACQIAEFILRPNAKVKVAKMTKELEDLGKALHRAALMVPGQGTLFGDATADGIDINVH